MTSPLLTWCMLAEVLNVPDLVAAADYLLSEAGGGLSVDAFAHAVAAWKGKAGVDRLSSALPQIRVGVRSRQETLARLVIVEAGLPEPDVNVSIYSDTGVFLAMPDIVYLHAKFAAEYEGDHHRSDRRQFRHDITRRERIEDDGWRLMRFTADDVRLRTAEFITRIALRLGIDLGPEGLARAVRLAATFEP